MKKLIMALTILVMSIAAFADGTSCSIRGLSGETITIVNENAQSDSGGNVSVRLSSSTSNTVNVVVYCYDAYTDEVVGVQSVRVQYGETVYFKNLKSEHPYYFRVRDAHCG